MAHVNSVDYDLKRIYLHQDTVVNGFDAIEAYFEVCKLRSINANGEQLRSLPYIGAEGKIKKTSTTYTPKFAYLQTLWRYVPYGGVTHRLSLSTEIVSVDELTDADVFDFTGLTVSVHIGSDYDQVEIIEVTTGDGGGATPAEIANAVWTDSERTLTSGSGGDCDLTETNALIVSSKNEVIDKIEDSETDIRQALIDIQFGNWTIVSNQMIIFDKQNVEIARFNLFDAAGNPTMRAVYKRELVQ